MTMHQSLPAVRPDAAVNISRLARELGVSRMTIRRRLANGWMPPVSPDFAPIEFEDITAVLG